MELQRARGVRDFLPEEKIIRQQIVETLKKTFELYGFVPIETPILERYDVLSSKYTGGEEILKETFRLKDQGKRQLALRYDLTVPMSRFVAMNPNLKMPFKRYQVGKVFRDGPIEKGRVREFWQCDVDTIGTKNMLADSEIVNLAFDAFKKLNFKILIKINNRKILDSIITYAGINKNKESVILTIDKLYKIGKEGVEKELTQKKLTREQIKKILELISIKGDNKEKLSKLKKIIKSEGLGEIEEILKYSNNKDLIFDPSLARGLAYYTRTIFEIVSKDSKVMCSIGGGGRYDEMIGKLIGRGEYPAVGISFGLDRIYEVWIEKRKKELKTKTKVYIIPIRTMKESLSISKKLRDSGINTGIDISEKGITKNLNYANALNIPYVLFIGEKELKQKKVKLKNMKTGKEILTTIDKVIKELK